MPDTRHIGSPRHGDVLLLVGTMKGAFILRADGRRALAEERRQWGVVSAALTRAWRAT